MLSKGTKHGNTAPLSATGGVQGQNCQPIRKPLTGHIRQRKNGLWEGQYTFQRMHRSIYGKTQEEVSIKLEGIITSIQEGNYIKPNEHTLLSWLREWLEVYAKPTLRPSTFTNYEFCIERHFDDKLGHTKLSNVSTKALQTFFNRKAISGRTDGKGGLSPKTLKNMRYMLHVALNQARCERLIPFNPVDGVCLPAGDRTEQRVLTSEEKDKICAHAATVYTLASQGIIILLTCGLRRGELLGLRWRDIDLVNGTMKIRCTLSRLKKFDTSKSPYTYIRLDPYAPSSNRTALYLGPVKTQKSVRTIYLPARAIQAFQTIRMIQEEYADQLSVNNPYDLVFCTEEGHPYEAKVLEEGFHQILHTVGLPRVNLHATRHTFATEALQKATDIVTVSEILGHTKPSTTLDMYGHTFDARKKALMAQM